MCSREESAITTAAEEIARTTGNKNVLPIAADLSTNEGCEVFVQTALGAFHAIDILIVNAGGPPPGRFDDLDDAAWSKAVDLTLFSAVRLTRLALPQMRKVLETYSDELGDMIDLDFSPGRGKGAKAQKAAVRSGR